MNFDTVPERNLILLTPTSRREINLLAGVPAWRGTTARPGKTPMIAIDAVSGVAALSEIDDSLLAPVLLVAPPLAGISRAVGLQLIFEAFGYRRFSRPFGAETVLANPTYIAGQGLRSHPDLDRHIDVLTGAVGIAALEQPRGTIWDLHAPIAPSRVLSHPAARAIYLVRDPRDAVVSAYFFFKRSTELAKDRDRISTNLTAADFDPARKEAALMSLISDGYAAVSPAGATRFPAPRRMLEVLVPVLSSERVFILRYERQHRDPARQYGELIAWLAAAGGGATLINQDAVIAEAVKRGTFAHQSGGAMVEGRHDEAPAASPTGHLRKGIVGDWRQHFSPAVRRAFHASVGALLVECGFETDPNWWKN